MKILRIIPSMNPKHGGPCQGIRNSIPALKNFGVENEVVCMDKPDAHFLGMDNFVIHAIGSSTSSWAYNPMLERWLKENFKKYDVIIIHGLWLYHSYATIKTIIKSRKSDVYPKIYVMPHGMLDPWFQKAKGRRLKAIRNRFYWHLIEKNVINQADGILFTCEQEMLLARETFSGYRPKAEYNVGYGIQEPPIYTVSMSEMFNRICSTNGKPYLLYLSRIHEKKGAELLVNAYLLIKKEGLKLPKLIIAGPGLDTPFGIKVKALASNELDIVFPGMLIGESKWGAIYGCEAFILPSHQENFGIAVAEALACGKPVLISDQVNIWKEIVNGQAGLVSHDTLEGTKDLFRRWMQLSNKEKNSITANSELVFQENFTANSATKRLLHFLQQDFK